jgi:hypothetical protein
MTYPYDAKDWMVDWNNVLEATVTVPLENKTRHLRRVFVARYPDEKEAFWRCNRVLAALRYMEENKEPLERAGWLLASSKSGTVGGVLSFALCGFFGQVDDKEVLSPLPVQEFIYVLEEFQRRTA